MDDITGDDSSDADIAGDDTFADVVRLGAKALHLEGPLRVFILIASAAGFWQNFPGSSPHAWPFVAEGQAVLVGAMLAYAWSFGCVQTEPLDRGHAYMRRVGCKQSQCRTVFGFLDCPVVEVCELREPVCVDLPCTRGRWGPFAGRQVVGRHASFGQVLEEWQAKSSTVVAISHVALGLAHWVLKGWCACLHTIPITLRIPHRLKLIPNLPSRKMLRRLQNYAKQQPQPQQSAKAKNKIPGWAKQSNDPNLVLDWLECTSHLKDARKAKAGAHSFARLFARCSKLERNRLLSVLDVVHHEILRRARVRLDCVCMMVTRLVWQRMQSLAPNSNIYICFATPRLLGAASSCGLLRSTCSMG